MEECLVANCKLRWKAKRLVYATFDSTVMDGLFIKLLFDEHICIFQHNQQSDFHAIPQQALKGGKWWPEFRQWITNYMVPLRLFASNPYQYLKEFTANSSDTSNVAEIRSRFRNFLKIYDLFVTIVDRIERVRYTPLEPTLYIFDLVFFSYIYVYIVYILFKLFLQLTAMDIC